MKKDLEYFHIGKSYGGSQEWFSELTMRNGGCGAATACETCIYFAKYRGKAYLYPYGTDEITREDYVNFGQIMKPYLHPRPSGIDTLELYMDGFRDYLKTVGEKDLQMIPFSGESPFEEAREKVIEQIDDGYPVPMLLLKHKNPDLDPFVWHWFMLTGYQTWDEVFYVRTVTFGKSQWLSLGELWDTGFERKGGLVLYRYD